MGHFSHEGATSDCGYDRSEGIMGHVLHEGATLESGYGRAGVVYWATSCTKFQVKTTLQAAAVVKTSLRYR